MGSKKKDRKFMFNLQYVFFLTGQLLEFKKNPYLRPKLVPRTHL